MQNGFKNSAPLSAKNLRFAVVMSRFNEEISEVLLKGACDTLASLNAQTVDVFKVPGAFEIPALIARLAEQKKYDALIALGTVIRGETPHFDYVCQAALMGINQVAITHKIPVANGIITADTLSQATDRAGGKAGHLGVQAALAAAEMAQVFLSLKELK